MERVKLLPQFPRRRQCAGSRHTSVVYVAIGTAAAATPVSCAIFMRTSTRNTRCPFPLYSTSRLTSAVAGLGAWRPLPLAAACDPSSRPERDPVEK